MRRAQLGTQKIETSLPNFVAITLSISYGLCQPFVAVFVLTNAGFVGGRTNVVLDSASNLPIRNQSRAVDGLFNGVTRFCVVTGVGSRASDGEQCVHAER